MADKSMLDNKYVKGILLAGTIFSVVQLGVTIAQSKPVAAMFAKFAGTRGQ